MQNQTVYYVQLVYIAHFISGYTSTLMQETLSAVKGASDEPVPCLPAVQPPPLCSGFIHPEKEDAILHFQSRFAGRETTV